MPAVRGLALLFSRATLPSSTITKDNGRGRQQHGDNAGARVFLQKSDGPRLNRSGPKCIGSPLSARLLSLCVRKVSRLSLPGRSDPRDVVSYVFCWIAQHPAE